MIGVGRAPARAWGDLARAGNLPSVWSNVLAALVLSTPDLDTPSWAAPWPPVALWLAATALGSLAYAGGAMLNDVVDADFDRRHRSDRAIPSGAVSRGSAAVVGVVLLVVAVWLFVRLGASWLWATGMAVVIVAYDLVHKRWAGSVVLMAACRAGLGLTVASLPGHRFTPAVLVWVTVVSAYIVCLSLLARTEYRRGGQAAGVGRWVGRLLAFMPLLDAAGLGLVGAWLPALACATAVPLGRGAQRLFAST